MRRIKVKSAAAIRDFTALFFQQVAGPVWPPADRERERDRGGREGPPPSSSSSLLLIIIGAVTSGGHQPQGYKAEGGVTEQKAAKQQQQKHLTTL